MTTEDALQAAIDKHPQEMTPRLLVAGGMRRWVGGGGGLPAISLDDWMALLEPLIVTDAAIVALRVLHGFELQRIGEHIGRYRQLADQRWWRALKVLRDERRIGFLRDMCETHSAPKGRYATSRRRRSRYGKLGDENASVYFSSLRSSEFFDRLFGEKRAD